MKMTSGVSCRVFSRTRCVPTWPSLDGCGRSPSGPASPRRKWRWRGWSPRVSTWSPSQGPRPRSPRRQRWCRGHRADRARPGLVFLGETRAHSRHPGTRTLIPTPRPEVESQWGRSRPPTTQNEPWQHAGAARAPTPRVVPPTTASSQDGSSALRRATRPSGRSIAGSNVRISRDGVHPVRRRILGKRHRQDFVVGVPTTSTRARPVRPLGW